MVELSRMLESELKVAIDSALRAGESILKHYENELVAEEKIGADNYSEPVTVADREASSMIVEQLAAAFPHDGGARAWRRFPAEFIVVF